MYDIDELIEKGNFILSLCEDVEDDAFLGMTHRLPVIDESKMWEAYDNWDLPEEDKKKVWAYRKELTAYAEEIVSDFFREIRHKDMLPPWIVFPDKGITMVRWRIGIGGPYDAIYRTILEDMTQEEFEAYKEKFPAPPFAAACSGYDQR